MAPLAAVNSETPEPVTILAATPIIRGTLPSTSTMAPRGLNTLRLPRLTSQARPRNSTGLLELEGKEAPLRCCFSFLEMNDFGYLEFDKERASGVIGYQIKDGK